MTRDPLRVLAIVRRLAVEQARRALGSCLQAEAEVGERIATLDATARRDSETARSWEHAHRFLEMAAVRLEVVRTERRMAQAELAASVERSVEARVVVTAARTDAEAVGQLIAGRADAERAEGERREQHALDDIARSRYLSVSSQRGSGQAVPARTVGPEPGKAE